MHFSPPRYSLSFEEGRGYLLARLKAERTDRETAHEYLEEIAKRCVIIGAQRLMIVRDIPNMLPLADQFFISNEFMEMTLGMRVAFVNIHLEQVDEMDFAIMIGTNRGANHKLFNDIEHAERWLLETSAF